MKRLQTWLATAVVALFSLAAVSLTPCEASHVSSVLEAPQFPLGLVRANTSACVYVIYSTKIDYACRGQIEVPNLVSISSSATRRIVSWASKVDLLNRLWFAVQSVADVSEFADLEYVRFGDTPKQNLLKIVVNSITASPNARSDMILASSGSLYVLGYATQPSEFGLYEIDSSGINLRGQSLPIPPVGAMRNPFFLEYKGLLLFRFANNSQDTVLSYNPETAPPIKVASISSSSTGNVTAFGPIASVGGSWGVFYAVQNDSSNTYYELFTNNGRISDYVSFPYEGYVRPVTEDFRGVFTAENAFMYVNFGNGLFFRSASASTFIPAIIDETYVEGSNSSIAYVSVGGGALYRLSGSIFYNTTDSSPGLQYGSQNAAVFSSRLFAAVIDAGGYYFRQRLDDFSEADTELSSCDSTLGTTVGMRITGNNLTDATVALFSKTGTQLRWEIGNPDAIVRLSPPSGIKSDIPAGIEQPYSYRLLRKVSTDTFVVGAQLQSSPNQNIVFATLQPSGNSWSFEAQLASAYCNDLTKPEVAHSALSPDGKYVVMDVSFGAYSRIYYGPVVNSSLALAPLTVSSALIQWAPGDLLDAQVPIAFGTQTFTIIARINPTLPLTLFAFSLNGTYVGQSLSLTGTPVWSVTPSFPQHLFIYNSGAARVLLDFTEISDCLSNCGISALGASDAVVWEPNASKTTFYLITDGVQNVSGICNYTVRSAFVIPGSGPEKSFVFVSNDLYVYNVSVFRQNVLIGERTVVSISGRVAVSVCGVWNDGIAFYVSGFELKVYRFSTNTVSAPYADEKLTGCTHLSSIKGGLFLLTATTAHGLVDLTPVGEPTITNLPLSDFNLFGRSDIITYPNRTGGNIIATVQTDFYEDYLSSSVVVLDTIVCGNDSFCPENSFCVDSVCKFFPPPATSGCAGPRPLPQAQCVGDVWIIQGDVVVSNGTIVVGSNTKINGSLVVTSGATITLTGTATLEATGCATFAGSLEVERPAPEQTTLGGRLVVVSFNGGYCNNSQTAFGLTTLRFVGQPACARRNDSDTRPEYSPTSLSIVFNYDLSDCSAGVLSTGAIAGIAIGAVALVAIIIGAVLILKFKNVIRPFSGKASTPHQTELD